MFIQDPAWGDGGGVLGDTLHATPKSCLRAGVGAGRGGERGWREQVKSQVGV